MKAHYGQTALKTAIQSDCMTKRSEGKMQGTSAEYPTLGQDLNLKPRPQAGLEGYAVKDRC
jgi:hypothetical protein